MADLLRSFSSGRKSQAIPLYGEEYNALKSSSEKPGCRRSEATKRGLSRTLSEWKNISNPPGSPEIAIAGSPNAYPTVSYVCHNSLNREGGEILSVAYAYNFVYVGTEGKAVNVWRSHFTPFADLYTGSDRVTAIHINTAKHLIFSAHSDRRVRIWRPPAEGDSHHSKETVSIPVFSDSLWSSLKLSASKLLHRRPITGMVSSDRYLYTASEDGSLKVWKLKKYKFVETIAAHKVGVNAVATASTPKGSILVFTASDDCSIRVWKAQANGKAPHNPVNVLRVPSNSQSPSAVKSLLIRTYLGGCLGVYGGMNDGDINLWDWKCERESSELFHFEHVSVLRGHNQTVLSLVCIGEYVISGSKDCTMRVWWKTAESHNICLQIIRTPGGPVKALAATFDQDNGSVVLYSGTLNGIFRKWVLNIK